MIDSNNFEITLDPCIQYLNCCFLIISIMSFCIAFFLFCGGINIIYLLMGPIPIFLFIFSLALICGCLAHHKIYLRIGDNSIHLTKKALLKTRLVVYNRGQLERAEIIYKYDISLDEYPHGFYFNLVTTKGNKINLFQFRSAKIDVDLKGIKYFADIINYHIQNNMKN